MPALYTWPRRSRHRLVLRAALASPRRRSQDHGAGFFVPTFISTLREVPVPAGGVQASVNRWRGVVMKVLAPVVWWLPLSGRPVRWNSDVPAQIMRPWTASTRFFAVCLASVQRFSTRPLAARASNVSRSALAWFGSLSLYRRLSAAHFGWLG